ncbi:metallophosphoesterase family protein [Ornithinibacillus scapharcae]|uniref:metallophosphoesterase family protein n=1 Tax=Ornithinibacillus scapharcae TaxID=1147159 RepID=UPI000225B87B|nr:metallophosphoesterase family protein [Ornithinibacillus scapharcae]
MINVQKLTLDKSKRIIITSDIHANLKLFKKLLEKVIFTNDDYLFINGDLCEKGPNSLEVLEYVRGLVAENDKIFVTKGNCDVVYNYVWNQNHGIVDYMKERKHSVLNEMLEKHGKSIDDFATLRELADYYQENFRDEISWLESLVTAYELEDHIIIHAGIDDIEDWYKTEENTALYTRAFQEQGHASNKTVIVGHWPVINYRPFQISSHVPLIDQENRIISIDGGNQIKKDGQLNALIIKDGAYSYTFVDELKKETTILRGYVDERKRVGTVTYPNYELSIINRGEYFTQCENVKLGVEQWIKNEYIIVKDGKFYCKDDLSATFLPVVEGERVKIVDDECEGYILVKKSNGDVGWIPLECISSR